MLAMPVLGWLFAWTWALPSAAAAFGSGIRAAFLPQPVPDDYLKRSAAFLLLRPPAFLANARDIAGLEAFLLAQASRYGALSAPGILITGDRDEVVVPSNHAMALARAAPRVKVVVVPGAGHMVNHAAVDKIVAAVEALTGAG
jgi:pimeloyl-ACP methyl ester carboxylesterase